MKKLIESLDKLQECPPEMGEGGMMPAPMDQGNPVSVNISMNASGKEHVEDLLRMMQQAGLGGAEEVKPDMMPMRMDMERLRDIVDEPKEEEIEEGGMKDQLIQAMEKIASDNSGELLYKALRGAMGPDVQNYLQDMYDDVAVDNGLHPDDDHDDIEEKMWDQIQADYGMGEAYANEPDYEYSDHEKMTHDLSGGINREKKAYQAAQRGDNAMAAESIRKELYKALAEKKKPDADGDGVPDWADKKPGEDDNEGKKKGSKPKKGVVPPQFKK